MFPEVSCPYSTLTWRYCTTNLQKYAQIRNPGRHEESPSVGEGIDARQQRAVEAAQSEPPTDTAFRFSRKPRPAVDAGEGKSIGARFPSVTLKLAMDRNGAVDDMSEGPKRFTSQASLDAGEGAGWQRACAAFSLSLIHI